MEEQIYINISRVLSGEASLQDITAFDTWLEADAKHRAIFEEAKTFWQDADTVLRKRQYNFEPALAAFLKNIQAERTEKHGRVMLLPIWLKYSAGVAAVLLVGYFLLELSLSSESITVTASSKNKRIELADHSIVTLRQGSSLSYPEQFANNERKVELTGEAFFEVTPDKQYPFVVDVSGGEVKVLGTSFNVISRNAGVAVVVKTGKVQLSDKNGSTRSVTLTPGEMGHLHDGVLTKQPVTVDEYLEWMDEGLRFKDRSLTEILAAVAKAKKVSIRFADDVPARSRDQKVSISFREQTIEELLNELCMVAKCRWAKEKGIYIIKLADG